MPLATGSIHSTPSDSRRTGPRRSVVPLGTRTSTGTRVWWSACTAETGRTRKWTAGQSPASTRPSWMWGLPMMIGSDVSYTTTSSGRRRRRCLVTTDPKMTCRMDSPSLTGPGTDSFADQSRLPDHELQQRGWFIVAEHLRPSAPRIHVVTDPPHLAVAHLVHEA